MAAYSADAVADQLRDWGYAVLRDDDHLNSLRAAGTRNYTGQYVSYYDPEERVVFVVLHKTIRQWMARP